MASSASFERVSVYGQRYKTQVQLVYVDLKTFHECAADLLQQSLYDLKGTARVGVRSICYCSCVLFCCLTANVYG